MKANVVFFGVLEGGFAGAVGDVVKAFHGDDVGVLAGFSELFHGAFRLSGQIDVADLAFFLEPDESAELVREGDEGIDPVELLEVNALGSDFVQAQFDLLA